MAITLNTAGSKLRKTYQVYNDMKCLVNDIIKTCVDRNKRVEVIHRFIRMKYHINMDRGSVLGRINAIRMNYNF